MIMQKPSVIVKDLVAEIQGITVLDGISFSLLPDQHLAIAGNAGSGKTTLANALAGRVHCSGTINFVSNTDFSISLVEQRYSFKNLSGINNFYYQQRFNSFDGSDAPTVMEDLSESISHKATHNCEISVDEILNALGIEHLKNAPLIQLSSGEHKRFQLAKALLNPPALLILDSPYTGLDVMMVKQLNELLNQISKSGTQIILIAGTFPIPGFITHIGHIEQKKFIFFGKKENYQAGKFASVAHSAAIKNHWVPVSKEDFAKGTVVEMKNVRIQYGHHVILNHLDWKIEQGEKWLLKGRNGAGKSSLLNLITADHPQAYSNEIYLFGKRRGSGESIWDIKKNIGYISPELHAYFDKAISCFEAIASGYFDTTGLYKKLSNTQCDYIKQWLDF
jgi:molybdate transport system ATP-binding protein